MLVVEFQNFGFKILRVLPFLGIISKQVFWVLEGIQDKSIDNLKTLVNWTINSLDKVLYVLLKFSFFCRTWERLFNINGNRWAYLTLLKCYWFSSTVYFFAQIIQNYLSRISWLFEE